MRTQFTERRDVNCMSEFTPPSKPIRAEVLVSIGIQDKIS